MFNQSGQTVGKQINVAGADVNGDSFFSDFDNAAFFASLKDNDEEQGDEEQGDEEQDEAGENFSDAFNQEGQVVGQQINVKTSK